MFKEVIKNREDYFAYNALNYSTLKGLAESPSNLLPSEDKKGAGLSFGKAIDTLLFDGSIQFHEEFFVSDTTKPTAATLTLAEAFIEAKGTVGDTNFALLLIKDLGLWSSTKKQEVLEAKLTDKFWNYIHDTYKGEGKIIIDNETAERISLAVYNLKNDQYSKPYFVNVEDHVTMFPQLAIAFNISIQGRDILMKAMLDNVIVDHKAKTVQPVDLKSMGERADRFAGSVWKWRYDIQAELYHEGVCHWAQEAYPGYKVLPFIFVVISSGSCKNPLVYQMNPQNYRDRMNANKINPFKGVRELVSDFVWHSDNQVFEYSKDMYLIGKIIL